MIAKGLENKAAYHEVVSLTGRLKEANDALMAEKAALNKKSEHIRFLFDLGTAVSATLDTREMVERVGQACLRNSAVPDWACCGISRGGGAALLFGPALSSPLGQIGRRGVAAAVSAAAPESISTMKAPSSGSGPASPPADGKRRRLSPAAESAA
jgi:hypothetical protein